MLRNDLARILKKQRPSSDLKVHLTVARFHPGSYRDFPVQYLMDQVSWTWDVASVALFESHLEPSGAEYEVLSEVALRARA